MSCGAEAEGNSLFQTLTAGVSFDIPQIDVTGPSFQIPGGMDSELYKEVTRIANSELTTTTLDGTGTFDVLMRGFKAHLKEEYNQSRITGAEYTKAYTALVESAMAQSVQFLLGKDASFWQAMSAQIQAITAKLQLETARVRHTTAQLEALNQEATFALTKMRLANENMQYCIGKFNHEQMLPAQKTGQDIANRTAVYNLDMIMPLQKAGLEHSNSTALFNLQNILPLQKVGLEHNNSIALFNLQAMLPQQHELLVEQTEVQRAQTLDTRSDGSTVVGAVGKQKDLYSQQIESYRRDSELKAAKLFADAWTVQKTVDEGFVAPANFQNPSLDSVLGHIKTNNNLA